MGIKPSLPISVADYAEPNILDATFDFVVQFAKPDVDPGNVFYGFQQTVVLPKDTNEFVFITQGDNVRHGTTIELYDVEDDGKGYVYLLVKVETNVQIDFYSLDQEVARARAQRIETTARSSFGPLHFEQYNVGCLYAENVRQLSFVDEDGKYLNRFMTLLHLSYWSVQKIEIPYFTNVRIGNIKDVDAFYPPKNTE